MPQVAPLQSGEVFGEVTVLRPVEGIGQGRVYECRCECGCVFLRRAAELRANQKWGRTSMCLGCSRELRRGRGVQMGEMKRERFREMYEFEGTLYSHYDTLDMQTDVLATLEKTFGPRDETRDITMPLAIDLAAVWSPGSTEEKPKEPSSLFSWTPRPKKPAKVDAMSEQEAQSRQIELDNLRRYGQIEMPRPRGYWAQTRGEYWQPPSEPVERKQDEPLKPSRPAKPRKPPMPTGRIMLGQRIEVLHLEDGKVLGIQTGALGTVRSIKMPKRGQWQIAVLFDDEPQAIYLYVPGDQIRVIGRNNLRTLGGVALHPSFAVISGWSRPVRLPPP